MHYLLSEQHCQMKKEFRSFVENELDLGDHYPRENLNKAARNGYMGLPIPRQWGGCGEDYLTYILFLEEVSRKCASTGVILSVHTSVGTFPLLYYGSEEQKKRYLPALAGGELLGAFALTEAGAGSDAAAISTTARKKEDGYLINGSKLFITSGGEADLFILFATIDRSMGSRAITAFLVEKNSSGFSAGSPEKKMGLNRSHTTELRMEDLYLPLANRLGAEGEGFNIAMSLLDGGRIGIAAQGLGIAQAAIEYSIEHFKAIEANGTRIEQGAAFLLADLASRLEAARLLVYRAAIIKEKGSRCSREASMAKMFATDLAVEAAGKAIELCGLDSATANSPLARYFCDAKATQIYEGSNQIQRIVVSRELFKEYGW